MPPNEEETFEDDREEGADVAAAVPTAATVPAVVGRSAVEL